MQKVTDQRARSSKPITIHACTQSGDLSAFQRLIALLNDRNAVMTQTPLHVAAGYNSIEVMKFLLDWQGTEKVEMEAKNMNGMSLAPCCLALNSSRRLLNCQDIAGV